MSMSSTTRVATESRRAGNGFVHSRAFEWLSRAGFVARGFVYAIIGILAFKLALGVGGKLVDQEGAFHTVAHQPFGSVLLTLLVIGLGVLWLLEALGGLGGVLRSQLLTLQTTLVHLFANFGFAI